LQSVRRNPLPRISQAEALVVAVVSAEALVGIMAAAAIGVLCVLALLLWRWWP
jgi:hypothetical protein